MPRRSKGVKQGTLSLRERGTNHLPSVILGNMRSITSLGRGSDTKGSFVSGVWWALLKHGCMRVLLTLSWALEESGKSKGRGLTLFVKKRWCHPGHTVVEECIGSPDIELLAVGLRLYYLPREFSHVIIIVVYIPPSANMMTAGDVISSAVASLQTKHPETFILISAGFNHVSLNSL